MKKRTMFGIGAGLLVGAVTATGCGPINDEEIETVYGPPVDISESIDDYIDEIEDIYGPPVYEDYDGEEDIE